MQKKTSLTLFVLSFLLLFCTERAFSQPLSDEERKLQDIKNELFNQKRKLKITKEKERAALQNLYIIQKELNKAEKKIDSASTQIVVNKKKILTLNSDMDKYQRNIRIKQEKLLHRIRETYKSSGGSIFEVLFGAVSISDFLNRTYYFSKIIDSDISLINEMNGEINNIHSAKKELNASNRQITGLIEDIKDEKMSIQEKKAQRQRMYELLKNRRQEYEKKVSELEDSSRQFEKMINRVVADKTRRGISSRGTGRFARPMDGRLVSLFGYRRHPLWGGYSMHTGIDIASPYGRPIRSSDEGEVIYSGWWDGYGKAVVIDHGRGYTTVYGHMSRFYVAAGQIVEQGQVIGLVGSTGFSTGPHLHFEIRKDGRPVNPLNYL